MANLCSFIFSYIVFTIMLQYSLTDTPLISLDKPYNNSLTNIEAELHLTLQINKTKNDTCYLRFSTSPLSPSSKDVQQIIFSTENNLPSTKNTEQYSFKFLRYADLITFAPNNTDTIFLSIKCLKYPCSFNFNAKMEKDLVNYTINENQNFYFYNSNSLDKEKFNKIKLAFPIWDKGNTNITVINPGDIKGDYMTFSYSFVPASGGVPIYVPIEERTIFEKGVIFSINKGMIRSNYFLEIESREYQFISISIKTSYERSINYYESDIIPNTVAKYSRLISESEINECFKINQDYINNYLNNNQQNNFLFASIEFISLPKKIYLNYSNDKISIENNKKAKNLNLILKKEDNIYPKVCFVNKDFNIESIFNIEISHLYQNMENIDIYTPIFSGYFNQKTLLGGTLGVYTHNSDIHFVEKLSFYLKPLKGKPKMYIFQCDDYPNCPNKLEDLNAKDKVYPAQDFGNYQFYTIKNKVRSKDFSPYGNSQNLLYVYCPSDEKEEYCQFEILIYSDLEEIVLDENKVFNAVTEIDDELKYKIIFKKGHKKFKEVNFCLDANEKDIYFNTFDEINNITVTKLYIDNMLCYKFIPDEKKLNNLDKNDLEIIFDIESNNNTNYTLKNFLNIVNNEEEIGEEIKDNQFSFPYELNYLISKTTSDLLFNIFLENKNQIYDFDNIEISAMILNETYLRQLQDNDETPDINKDKTTKLDPATRTAVVNIKKEDINNLLGQDKNKYYLHFVFINNGQKINQELNSKIFLLEKKSDEFIIEKNNFISDKISLDNSNKINLYHIKMENNTILEIKFSSNYPIDDNFLVYLIDYKENSNINIDYLEKNKKEFKKSNTGQMYTFYLDKINSNVDITFAVVSKLETENISILNINYIFKYNIYSNENEYDKKGNYIVNDNCNITHMEKNSIFEFDSIKKNTNQLNTEIYIRKILKDNLLANESLSTFAKIESKYEILKGNKNETNEKIRITVPKISTENYTFSILVDVPDENEKFVISNIFIDDTKPTPIPIDSDTTDNGGTGNTEEQSNESNGDNSLILKIVIPIVSVILVIGIVFLILFIRKRKGGQLKQSILKTSFQEGDSKDRALVSMD